MEPIRKWTLSQRFGSLRDILKPQVWCIQWPKSPYLSCKSFVELFDIYNQMYLSKCSQAESRPCLRGLALCRTSWNPKADAFNDRNPPVRCAKVLLKSLIHSIKCIWVFKIKVKSGKTRFKIEQNDHSAQATLNFKLQSELHVWHWKQTSPPESVLDKRSEMPWNFILNLDEFLYVWKRW